MNTTEIIAVAAIVGTLLGILAGTWLESFQSARRQRSAELRELSTALYIDVAVYSQQAEAMLTWLTGDWPSRKLPATRERPNAVLLSARIQLLAPTSVQLPWASLLEAEEILDWNLTENGDLDPHGGFIATTDQEDVKAVRNAIEQLKSATRAAVGS